MPLLAHTGLVNRFISSALILFFKLLYSQFAWAYDWVAAVVSIGRWKSWIFVVLPYLGDSNVLELGSGPGHLQVAHSPQKGSIFGLDASRQMLQQARRRLAKHNRTMNLVLGKAQFLPYRDQSFPIIVATFPSNYINDPRTLDQVWRVLEVNGELIVLPAAWISGETMLDKFAAWLFKVTGQSPDIELDHLGARFAEHIDGLNKIGFHVSCDLVELQTSKIFLIRARKFIPD